MSAIGRYCTGEEHPHPHPIGLFSSNTSINARLDRIERKLDALLAALGISAPGGKIDGSDFPEVRGLVQRGKKIEAIKLYRERTGVGLAEAKAFVDAIRT